MTDEQRIIPISEPDDFVAAIPAIIGMIPEDNTAVIVVLNEKAEIRLTLMVPINPSAMRSAIDHLSRFSEEQCGMILALVVSDLLVGREALQAFGDSFPVPLVSLFFIADMTPGSPYMEMILKYSGAVPDYRDSQLTAEAVASGRTINRTMADISTLYLPTEPAVSPATIVESDVVPVLLELGEAVAEYQPYDPAKVGALLIFSPQVRDATLEVTYVSAPAAHTIFAEAGRRLRGPARVEALSAAGLAAYVDGEGVMARYALHAAKETAAMCEPLYVPELAMTLDSALDNGISPDIIAHSVFQVLYDEEENTNDQD